MPRKISELFYEIRARTEGLQQDLDQSERHLGKWSDFVAANPTAVAGALGAGIVGIGLKATQMAAEMDASARKIAAASGMSVSSLDDITDAIKASAKEAHQQKEVVKGAAEEIARLGVGSVDELKSKLDATLLIADATGTAIGTVAGGIDQLADAFEVPIEQITNSVAQLFSASKGRSDIDSVFEAIQSVTPHARELGLELDVTTRALVALLERGLSGKQAKKEFEKWDASGLREIAKGATIAADATGELTAAADVMRGSLQRTREEALEQFSAKLVVLGEKILPVVMAATEGWVHVIDLLSTSIDSIEVDSATASVVTLSGAIDKVGEARKAEALERIREALRSVMDQVDLSLEIGDGFFSRATTEQLRTIETGLSAIVRQGAQAGREIENLSKARAALDARGALRPVVPVRLEGVVVSTPATPAAPPPRTIEQIKAAQKAAEEAKKAAEKAAENLRKAIAAFDEQLATKVADITANTVDQGLIEIRRLEREFADLERKAGRPLPKIRERLGEGLKQIAGAYLERAGDKVREAMKDAGDAVDRVLRDQFTQLARLTETAVDDLREQARQLREELERAGTSPELVTRIMAAEDALIDATASGEQLARVLRTMDDAARDGLTLPLVEMKRLTAEEERIRAQLATLSAADYQARQAYEAQLAQIEARRGQLIDENTARTEAAAAAASSMRQELAGAVSNIESAANAAFGLVSALGMGDTAAAKLLGSVGQIAGGIESLLTKGWQGFASLGAVGAIVGGGIAAVSALTGRGPEDEARRQAMHENTQALRALADRVGLLGTVSLSGSDITRAQQLALEKLHDAGTARGRTKLEFKELSKEDLDLLERAAKELGVNFDRTVGGVQALYDALHLASHRVGEFGTSLQDAERIAKLQIALGGVTAPGVQLAFQTGAARERSPAIAALFAGLDFNNVDVAELRARVRALFQRLLPGGGDGLSIDEMGGLSGTEILDVIEQIIAAFPELGDALGSGAAQIRTFGDAMRQLEETWGVFDITDPVAQIHAARQAMASLHPEIARVIDGLDLSTVEGVREAQQQLRALYAQSKASGASEQFLQALLAMETMLGRTADHLVSMAEQAARAAEEAAERARDARRSMRDTVMSNADAAVQLFGVTDASAQLRMRARAMSVNTPALGGFADRFASGGAIDTDAARQHLRELFNRFTSGDLTRAEMGDLSPEEFRAALLELLKGLEAIDDAARDAATAADEAAKAEAERAKRLLEEARAMATESRRAAVSRLGDEFTVFGITDPRAQLQRTAEVYARFAPALAGLFEGLDLESAEGIGAVQARIRELFKQIEAGGTIAGTAGLSLDEIRAALVALAGGADAAARAIADASVAFSQAAAEVSSINARHSLLGRLGGSTDPVAQAREVLAALSARDKGLATLLGGADVGSASGRAAIRDALRTAVLAGTDGFVGQAIPLIVDALAGIGEDVAAQLGGGGAGSDGTVAQAMQSITAVQADRLLDETTSIRIAVQTISEHAAQQVAWLARLAAPIVLTPLLPPAALIEQLRATRTGGIGALGGLGSDAATIVVHVRITNHFGDTTPAALRSQLAAAAEANAAQTAAEIDRALGETLQHRRLLAGDTRRGG